MPLGFIVQACCTDGDNQLLAGKIPNLINNALDIASYRIKFGITNAIDDHRNLLGICLRIDNHNALLFLIDPC